MLRVCLKKLEMGDVFDCRQSVNTSMARQMVLLYSGRRLGLFTM